jgi:hypothetical protein
MIAAMHITGSCHCGALRYQAEIDPGTLRVCHCTDCQRLSGSAFRASVRAVAGSLRVVAGTPRLYIKTAESGNRLEQAFCGDCGSHVFGSVPAAEPPIVSVRFGSIDQRDQLRPVAQIWTRSRCAWVAGLGDVPAADTQ